MNSLIKAIEDNYETIIEMFRYNNYIEYEESGFRPNITKHYSQLSSEQQDIIFPNFSSLKSDIQAMLWQSLVDNYKEPGIYRYEVHSDFTQYQKAIDDYLKDHRFSVDQLCRYAIVGTQYNIRVHHYFKYFDKEKLLFLLLKPKSAFERKQWLKFYVFNMLIKFYKSREDLILPIKPKLIEVYKWYDFVLHNHIPPHP